ncbi:hypothetical protein [uncultured Sphingobium sp.]|uniref:hypothetical protein n=1 Tax=uncultured Sphingobium sp. TaxID=316087 RepID=UPI002632217C|nr:hypothetical protein [uncultured Sphingobium sp.]
MQSIKSIFELDFWRRTLSRTPLVLRAGLVVWLNISFAFYVGGPSSTVNLPPYAAFLAVLPSAAIALWLSLFVIWRGMATILFAWRSISQRSRPEAPSTPVGVAPSVGGWGALNIYLIVYASLSFWLAHMTSAYTLSVVLSCLLSGGFLYILIKRRPLRGDVKILLYGGLAATILFGLVMATVAVPPA